MAKLIVALHQMPTDGFPVQTDDLVGDSLQSIEADIQEFDLRGLKPGLEWLRRHRPPRLSTSIVHLDYHPMNIVVTTDRQFVIVDWSEASVGDRHADLGRTDMLIRCGPTEGVPVATRPLVGIGRKILCKRLLKAYRQHLPVDPQRLDYYRSWTALRQLGTYGLRVYGGTASSGGQPTSQSQLADQVQSIENYFHEYTGVRVTLFSPSENSRGTV